MERRELPSSAELAHAFAEWTAARLKAAIAERGATLLIVSGGMTPVRYFQVLSGLILDWSRVSVTLADERRVPEESSRSNARLVRENLLVGRAARAHFAPLADSRLSPEQELAAANARVAALPLPADVAVLGMGEDGHTASWFPGADRLAEAIDPGTRELVLPIVAPDAPEPRLTLTARVILRARTLALHIEGDAKLKTLSRALEGGPIEEMPIRAALRGASDRLTIFSTAPARQTAHAAI